jgi:dTDP-4-amino-4,6-dideoxygalactose transaminase
VKKYNTLLADCDVITPPEMPWAKHVYHVYTLRSQDRDGLQAAMASEGIQTGIHYPVPVHLQPAYADLGYKRGAFPRSEKAAAEVLSLPLFPEMTDAQIEAVCHVVQAGVHAR